MAHRKRTEGQLQQIKNQTTLGFAEEKIWEDRAIALARYKINGKHTREIVKTLIVRAGKGIDVYNEEQIVKIVEIAGSEGYKDATGDTYKIGKKETEIMAGDGLQFEPIPGKIVDFFNFFGGKIEYNDIEHYYKLTLNPKLEPYYNKLARQFTVLMLNEYLNLSYPFYKDLYEWLIAHQGATDFPFPILIENFCKQFNCEKSLARHRDDVWNRLLKAKEEIESLTLLRFEVSKHHEERRGCKRKGKIDKFNFIVHTGPYYLAIQEKQQQEAEAAKAEIEATKDKQGDVFECEEAKEKPLSEIQVEIVERDMEEERKNTVENW